MKWISLYHKIGKQHLSVTQHKDVYAVIDLGDGKGERKIPLKLKFDKVGHPYLVADENVKE